MRIDQATWGARPRHTRRTLALLGALALLPLYSPGESFDAPPPFEPVILGPLLKLDAGEIGPDEVVDLQARATDGDLQVEALGAIDFEHFQRVALLEVLDSNRLIVETSRGTETVTLFGIRGTLEILPAEVNHYIRQTALPAIERYLRAGELFEVPPHGVPSIWAESIWQFPDAHGRRVVQLVRRTAEGLRDEVSAEFLRRGWAVVGPTFAAENRLAPYMLLAPDTPALGLRTLDAWKSFVAPIMDRTRAVLALTDSELTERARAVQATLAEQLAWEPEAELAVDWVTPAEARSWWVDRFRGVQAQRLAQAAQEAEDREPGVPLVAPIRQSDAELRAAAGRYAHSVVAWSPEGPEIHLVRKPWACFAGLDLLDEVLSHEIAHQYQEHLVDLSDVGSTPTEGHATWITQAWLDERHPGRLHVTHEVAGLEFRALLETSGESANAILTSFLGERESLELSNLRYGLVVQRDDPLFPQPLVELVAAEGRRPVLRLSNLGETTLAGQYGGRWLALPRQGDEGLAHAYAEDASPPFHLVLPPGTSLQIRLSSALLMSAPEDPVYRGVWSPTHGSLR